MKLSYRTRQILKRVAIVSVIVALVAALVGALWFIWLERFVVYTRDRGAVFDKTLTEEFPEGNPAKPREEIHVDIYYNEGENAIHTSQELTKLVGYYADSDALEKGVGIVLEQGT